GGQYLRDTDYQTNADAKTKEIRSKYLQHVANMLELIGESKAQAAADAKTVMRIETDLAKESLTRVERRNPYNLYHKVTPTQLSALTPSFDWTRYLADTGLAHVKTLNVPEPNFFSAVDKE